MLNLLARRPVYRPARILLAVACLAAIHPSAYAGDKPDDKTPADAKITAGSVWKGTWTGDDRRARAATGGATLRVKSRDGQSFKGTLTLRGDKKGARTLDVDGRSTPKGDFALKVTAIENGTWPPKSIGAVLAGQVDGNTINFKIPTTGGTSSNADAVGMSVSLTVAGDDN